MIGGGGNRTPLPQRRSEAAAEVCVYEYPRHILPTRRPGTLRVREDRKQKARSDRNEAKHLDTHQAKGKVKYTKQNTTPPHPRQPLGFALRLVQTGSTYH